MAWLRIDDRFTEHRKIVALRRADRWTWLELLGYCARHGSGYVPAGIPDVLRYVTPALLSRFVEVGLLDEHDDGSFEVHDWNVYNAATLEARVQAHLDTSPDATANEVWKATGGNRSAVLRIVAAMRGDISNSGSPSTTRGGSAAGSASVPRARDARARGPSPTPRESPQQQDPHHAGRPDPDDAARIVERLRAAGWSPSQLTMDVPDLPRAEAWLDHAEHDPSVRNPGGLAWSGFASNVWPPEARLEIAPGAMGTRSTQTPTPHVCPHDGLSFTSEARLIEHLEIVHDDTSRHGNGRDPEPVVDLPMPELPTP